MNKYIHHITVIYLALIMLVRMMAMPISLAEYSLNKSFIAGNLCENKLKPEMHCAGKCYLHKQLARGNDSQESRDQKGIAKNQGIDFFQPLNKLSFGCAGIGKVYSGQNPTLRINSCFTSNIFHPPIA